MPFSEFLNNDFQKADSLKVPLTLSFCFKSFWLIDLLSGLNNISVLNPPPYFIPYLITELRLCAVSLLAAQNVPNGITHFRIVRFTPINGIPEWKRFVILGFKVFFKFIGSGFNFIKYLQTTGCQK
jgi:hypothetical protein